MNLNKYTIDEIQELLNFIKVIFMTQVFTSHLSPQEVTFEVKKISAIKLSNKNDGTPASTVIAPYRFNYKIWFERLAKEGYLEIDRKFINQGFRDWHITTNSKSISDLQNEVEIYLGIRIKQDTENIIEVRIRDGIRNNPTLQYPTLNFGKYILPSGYNLSIKNEKLKSGECDIVIRSETEILNITEITCGSISDEYITRRVPKRQNEAPKASIWIIGGRVNSEILYELTKLNIYVTKFAQLREMNNKIFNFLP